MKNKIFKISKIGGSHWLHIPHEYMKVFELFNNGYNLEVRNSGNTLIYKKVDKKVEEIKEQSIINNKPMIVNRIIAPVTQDPIISNEEQLQEEALLAVQ